ncbi:MAG: hypothetical protein ACI4WW_01880 [Candidatus Coprovivens sp.]
MIGQRKKLRLRKEVYYVIPIAMLLATFLTLLVINSKRMELHEVEASPVESNTTVATSINSKVLDRLINNYNNHIYIRQRDNTIIYYASKFKLDINKTLELAHNYTNYYHDENYLQTFVIGPDKVKQRMGSFQTEEAGIIYFVKDLYSWPQTYGLEINEIRTSEEPDISRTYKDGKILLENGLTYEQFVAKISNDFGLNPKLVLAISYLETGYLQSGLFVYNNNVGGMRGYDGWMEFTTLEAGAIAHVVAVKAIIDRYGIDMNSDNAISELSSIYVNGYEGQPDAHWTEKVTIIFNNINEEDLLIKQ